MAAWAIRDGIQRPLVFSADRAEALKEIQRSVAFSVETPETREGIFLGFGRRRRWRASRARGHGDSTKVRPIPFFSIFLD